MLPPWGAPSCGAQTGIGENPGIFVVVVATCKYPTTMYDFQNATSSSTSSQLDRHGDINTADVTAANKKKKRKRK
jgi:hypothetical protein